MPSKPMKSHNVPEFRQRQTLVQVECVMTSPAPVYTSATMPATPSVFQDGVFTTTEQNVWRRPVNALLADPAKVYKKADMKAEKVYHVINWYTAKRKKEGGAGMDAPVWGEFEGTAHFFAWYKNRLTRYGPQQGVCETIPSTQRCLLYADFDVKGLSAPVVGGTALAEQEFVANVARLLREDGVVDETWQPVVACADGSRPTPTGFKASAHLVFNNVAFPNIRAMKAFVQRVVQVSNRDGAVDLSVYRGGLSNMRLVGSYKWSDDTKTPLTVCTHRCWGWGDKTPDLADFMVSLPSAAAVDVPETAPPATSKGKRTAPVDAATPKAKRVKAGGEESGKGMNEEEKAQILAYLDKKFPGCVQNATGRVFSVLTRGERVCALTGVTHHNNNGYVSVDVWGNATFGCHSGKCRDGLLALGNVFAAALDVRNLFPSPATTTVHTRDVQWVQPLAFEEGRRCLVIQASMGMGKSTQVKSYIDTAAPQSVLIVTCRQTLAEKFAVDFVDYTHYKKASISKQPFAICQYESLHKLSRTFDLVVLDEVRSLCACAASLTTNHGHLRDNADMFKMLVKQAKHVIALDADVDVDGAVANVLTNMVPAEQIQVEKYTFTRLVRHWQVYSEESQWYELLLREVAAGRKLAVPCRTNADACRVAEACRSVAGEHAVGLFTGDSDDFHKAQWARPDDLVEYQVVVYTCTVSVGCDVLAAWDQLFVHASDTGGCCARDLHQMVGRFRVLNNPVVVTHMPRTLMQATHTAATHEEQLQKLKARRSTLEPHVREVVKFKPVRDGDTDDVVFAPAWYTNNYAYVKDENRRKQFGNRLLALVHKSGGRWIWMGYQHVDDKLVEQVHELKNMKFGVDEAEVFETVQQMVADRGFADAVDTRVRTGKAMEGDKDAVTLYKVARHYSIVIVHDAEQMKLVRDKNVYVKRMADLTRATDAQLREADEASAAAGYADVSYVPRVWVKQQVTALCNTLGLAGVTDTDTLIPAALFADKDKADALMGICTAVKDVLGLRWQTLTTKDAAKQVKTRVSATWHSLLGAELTMRRQKNRGVWDVSYALAHDPQVVELIGHADYWDYNGWLLHCKPTTERTPPESDLATTSSAYNALHCTFNRLARLYQQCADSGVTPPEAEKMEAVVTAWQEQVVSCEDSTSEYERCVVAELTERWVRLHDACMSLERVTTKRDNTKQRPGTTTGMVRYCTKQERWILQTDVCHTDENGVVSGPLDKYFTHTTITQ